MLNARGKDWRPAIVAAVAALALYAVTLRGTFVYDDWSVVVDDPRVADVSRWREYLTKDYFNGGPDNLYRPLVSLSYAAQAKLHGNDVSRAWAFHLVNWLLHAAACAAVAEMARRMTRSAPAALVAGLLFAAHPIHVEAVANVVGRAELACGLGIFAAIVLFLAPPSFARTLGIWAWFLVALLSKEQGMLVPLLLVLAIPLRPRAVVAGPGEPDAAPSGDPVPSAASDNNSTAGHAAPAVPPAREAARAATPAPAEPLAYAQADTLRARRYSGPALLLVLLLIWTLSAYILFRERILKFEWDRAFLNPSINPLVISTGADRWLMPLVLLGRYAALLVAPVRLSPDYGGGAIGSHALLSDPYLWLGATTVVGCLAACVFALRRRAWAVLFCLLAFGLLYGMVSNLLALIGTNFNERLMYIPSAFACVLAAIGLTRLPRRVAVVCISVILALLSARTVTYAAQWNNPTVLYTTAIAHQPRAVQLYLLLGEERARLGDFAGAREAMARARDVAPLYYRSWLYSARIELLAGDPDAALRYAMRSFQIQPSVTAQAMIAAAREAKARASPTTPTTPTRPTTDPATTRAVR